MGAAVQVHQDINKLAARLKRHVDGWRCYADIWRADRAALLDKFRAKAPPTAAFEEKFAKFQKVHSMFPAPRGGRCVLALSLLAPNNMPPPQAGLTHHGWCVSVAPCCAASPLPPSPHCRCLLHNTASGLLLGPGART